MKHKARFRAGRLTLSYLHVDMTFPYAISRSAVTTVNLDKLIQLAGRFCTLLSRNHISIHYLPVRLHHHTLPADINFECVWH
jgi:hypothetical protein